MCSNVHHWVELRVEGDSIGLSALFCQESYTIYPTNHSQSQAPKAIVISLFSCLHFFGLAFMYLLDNPITKEIVL